MFYGCLMAGLHDISFIKCIAARHIGSNTSLFDYSRAQTRHERPQGRDLSKYHEYYTSTEHLPKRQMLRNCINKRVYGLVMHKLHSHIRDLFKTCSRPRVLLRSALGLEEYANSHFYFCISRP